MMSIDMRKTLRLFRGRIVKYLSILFVFILMTLPLIQSTFSFAKNSIINASATKLRDGMRNLETQLQEGRQIGNLLLYERAYMNLLMIKGAPKPEHYPDIDTVQSKLAKICLTRESMTNVFLLFKDNPIFISNYISADDYRCVYPRFLNYPGQTAEEWYEGLFSEKASHRVLQSGEIYSSYYSHNVFRGISCVIGNSYFEGIGNSGVLVCVLNEDALVSGMLQENTADRCFVYLVNSEGSIVFSRNYTGAARPNTASGTEIDINGESYYLVASDPTELGFQGVVGIPLTLFNASVNTMVSLVMLYASLGVLFCLLLSLFFTVRETLSVKRLMDIASVPYSGRRENEYAHIGKTIISLRETNEEHIHRIQTLNDTIRACALENLLILGVYTQNEKDEIALYFDDDFDFFCVALVQIKSADQKPMASAMHQEMLLRTDEYLGMTMSHKSASVKLSASEIALLIFLQKNDPVDIKHIKEELMDFIQLIRSQSNTPPTVNIGLSTFASGMDTVRESYMQAKDAINMNVNDEISGVFIYDTPRSVHHQKTIDIALFIKCYDSILCGDRVVIGRIFSEIRQKVKKNPLSEQERMQLFYSLRQPLYNAYLEIASGRRDEDCDWNIEQLQFEAFDTTETVVQKLEAFTFTLCDAVERGKRKSNEKLKEQLLGYIADNFCDPALTAGTIAAANLISEKYVYTVIKESTGKSLRHLVDEMRITKSEELLCTTEFSNSVIAGMCGFGSDKTFYRSFSKKHGISPTLWRKNT